jgi:lipoprotein signal peptidase
VWSLLTGSHQTVYGIVLGIVVVAVLVLLFSPPSSQWMAAEYSDVDDEPRL